MACRCRLRPTCCSSSFPISPAASGGKKAKALAAGQDPDGDAATLDVLAALQKFAGIRPDPEAFIEALDPLQPRVYSISSSPKCNPGRVSLTVDAVRYEIDGRTRLGVASTFLAGRIEPGDKMRVYVQKAQHFALPADPNKPIIMIGPGTGVAPFRAFLQERIATQAPGPNWLFFRPPAQRLRFLLRGRAQGDAQVRPSHPPDARLVARRRRENLRAAPHARGRPRSLGLARAMARISMSAATRCAWPKMSNALLIDVVAEHGERSAEDAARYVAELKKNDRYQVDVY